MKFDMHCHTKEGSIDAKVPIEEYIRKLIKDGFDGMLVTDHNSYKGYEKYKDIADKMNLRDRFTVLKGIEYDTRDAGHFIAILPEGVNSKLLEIRGMTLDALEEYVHKVGGVLGPAHPFGTGYFAFSNTKFGKINHEYIKKFDFIETFNSCTKPLANLKADVMATLHNKPKLAGSDAHKERIVGTAFTDFKNSRILNNDDLISVIKAGRDTVAGGKILDEVVKKKNKIVERLGIAGYWVYNKSGALKNRWKIHKIYHKIDINN